ncbi:MAG: hypothetical protein NTZ17_03060 [Phycisphaerae bacterium]|nr:hypothetical protein [Phycisphaerae bacterium]
MRSSWQVDRRILGDTLEDLEKRRTDRLTRRPSVWRRVMRTRTAKLAAAAVIVAAILLSIPHVNDNVVKAVEFEEITQAMQHVPWMHAVTAGFQPLASGPAEQWIGFETKISANKSADGTARFMSERDHQQFDYDPHSKTITARYLEALPIDMTSPAAMLTAIHKVAEQQGAQIDVTMGTYQGHKAQIQSFTLSSLEGLGAKQSATLYIDPETKLLYCGEVKAIDAEGKVVTAGTITFDYPSSGPQSIYDLGVPRDAQIEGNAPGASIQSLLNQYERARAEATGQYIAVLAIHEVPSRLGDDTATIVEVDFKSGRQRRWESHSVFHGRESAEVRAQYRQQMGDSFDSLLAWTGRHYDSSDNYLSIMCYDGQYYASVQRDSKGVWGKLKKEYSPGGSIRM